MAKPAAKPRVKRAATGANAPAGHVAPKPQPDVAPEPVAPDGTLPLGTVHLPKSVKADGKPLPAGTYQVRLTADETKTDAQGSAQKLERWGEFLDSAKGRGPETGSSCPAPD